MFPPYKDFRTRCSVGRGFTLIELLAVTGIIAVLAAVGFAGISRTRDGAMGAKSVSNLRAIAALTQSFVVDRGYYPKYTEPVWCMALYPYAYSLEKPDANGALPTKESSRLDNTVFINPRMTQDVIARYGWEDTYNGQPTFNRVYGLNSALIQEGEEKRPQTVKRPSTTCLYMSSVGPRANNVNKALGPAAEIGKGRFDVLFCDGHIATLKAAEIPTISTTLEPYSFKSFWQGE